MNPLLLTLALFGALAGQAADISVLDGPDACHGVLQPYSSRMHAGGHLCSVPAQPPVQQGASFIDFNFGAQVTAATPPGASLVHGYGFPSPLSATNRYLCVTDPSGTHYALDRSANGALIPIPNVNAACQWHPSDDDIYWYLSGPKILAHHVTTATDTVAFDFTGTLSKPQNGGSVHNSSDGWTTVWSAPEHTLCAVDLLHAASYCADYLAPAAVANVGFSFIDFSGTTEIDSGSGKRYAVLIAAPSMGVWSVDVPNKRLVFELRGPELPGDLGFSDSKGNHDDVCNLGENCFSAPHGDFTSIAGIQYFIGFADTSSTPCQRDLAAYPIAAGLNMMRKRTTIATLGYCSSAYEWTDIDVGCSPLTGACAISTYSNTAGGGKSGPFSNSIMLMPDLGHLVKLAFHRSVRTGSDTYWYQPRAAISRDGRYVVYDSNLGQSDQGNGLAHEQVFLLRTR